MRVHACRLVRDRDVAVERLREEVEWREGEEQGAEHGHQAVFRRWEAYGEDQRRDYEGVLCTLAVAY